MKIHNLQVLHFAFLATFGYFIFSTIDVLVKILSQNMSIFQITIQSAIFIVIINFILNISNLSFKISKKKTKLFLTYIVMNAINVLSIFYAFSNLPLIEVYPILLLMPVITFLFNQIFLRNQFVFSDFFLIIIGFIGCILVIEPTFNNFSFAHLVACLGTITAVIRAITTSRLNGEVESYKLIIGSQITLLFFISILFPVDSIYYDLYSSALIFLIAFFATCAMKIMIYCYAHAPVHIISFTLYSQIIWGILYSFFLFQDNVKILDLAGSFLIILSGFLLFYFKQRKFLQKPS
jgi:S-adenosylmethionine uptake transporter